MRWSPRALLPVAVGVFIVISAAVAQALPAQNPDNTGMVDFPAAGSGSNAVAVRTIAQAGNNVWVGGIFTEIDDQNGNKIQDASSLAVFNATTGSIASGVHIPSVTQVGGGAEIYDSSVGPDGNVYFAGNFDHVDGQPRGNVFAVDGATGALTPFNPGTANANAILATASAVYVGTARLQSFQLNGNPTPGYTAPTAIINANLRAHQTLPQFRDMVMQGNTVVAACQCDSITDSNGTRTVKAVVEINAGNGNWVNWRPSGLDDSSAAFGINVILHPFPIGGASTVYLAAGGSDFTAAYDFASGTQKFKEDTSGSSQAITWYQGQLVIGGHFDWSLKANQGSNSSCQDNDHPNPTNCWHTPKLTALSATTGDPILINNLPWNPGIGYKYNGVWALLVGNDGSTLNVGGEFTKVGGTWSGSGLNWTLNGGSTQQFWARFGGPAATTQTLSVQKAVVAGATGTVTSNPTGINCNTACSGAAADFTNGVNVTLTATASAGDTFTGWSSSDAGFNCPGTGACTVNMNIARTVTANFAGVTFPLTVSKTGSASASSSTVTSDTGGISCGSLCSAQIPQNTVVTLTATTDANTAFTGWSGSGCSGTGTCVVTMDAAKSVSAGFSSSVFSVTLNKMTSTTGKGTVTSSPAGISCTNACTTQTAPFGVPSVTLSQTPGAGDAFAGWTSTDPGFTCDGLGPCTLTMDQSRTVVAHFDDAKNVKLSSIGAGGGTVTSDPAIMNCTAPIPSGTTCDQPFAENSSVTLIATPDANSVFTGWSSTGTSGTFVSCTGTAPCTFNIGTAAKLVTANFSVAFPLTVHPDGGAGGGTVTSNPAGISCGLTCSAHFASGTNVILQAVPDANSTFTGWSGAGCSGTGNCAVPMTSAQSVTATFTLVQHLLSVSVTGHGTLTSTPGTINCGPAGTPTCTNNIDDGTQVALIPTPDSGWSFSGWGGACSGTGDCVVTMTADQTVTATFEQITHTVNVSMAGSGTGVVTSSPDAGINCPGDCTEGFAQNASESLLQTADSGSIFTGWSGACTGTGACNLTIDGAKNVTATFELLYTLTADAGVAGGSITSTPGAINCPGTCSDQYANGTQVQLTANPDTDFALAAWGGDCASAGSDATCTLTIDGPKSVSATWDAGVNLTVATNGGAGSGTVTSTPGGINCGSNCSHSFALNSFVTLHAAAGLGSAFTEWNSADLGFSCAGTGDCTVTMDMARNVTATFQPAWTLSVSKSGTGAGTVTSTPGAIDCGATCSDSYLDGTGVTLHAAPDANSTFTGWSGNTGGGCSTNGDCVVPMDQARTITANFDPIMWPLSITKITGTGTGTVTSLSPFTGINCGATCGANFQQGSSVVLHAAADANSTFIGWTGSGCTGTSDCTVSMSASESVDAHFDLTPRQLSVSKNGSGTGTVTSSPVGISCGATCSANFGEGTVVGLTATPDANMVFGGWSGACTGTGACNVMMSGAQSVTATFNATGGGTTTLNNNDPAVAYKGWFGVTDGAANGGFYRMSHVKNDSATWKSPVTTSITWVTRTGPDQGKASVTIDGTSHGTVDLYSASPGTLNKVYSGLSSRAHSIVIKVLLTKNAASSGFNVRLDAFVVGATTTQEFSPAIKYDTWKSTTQAAATDGTYRCATAASATVTVTFTGTGIDWITAKGKAYGKASVKIDGVSQGTFDLYQLATAYQSLVSFTGLIAGPHTMVIQVLGQKNASATSTKVPVDGFIVHS